MDGQKVIHLAQELRARRGQLILPPQVAQGAGIFVHDVNGHDEVMEPNLLVTEGLNYLLDVGFHQAAQQGTWYIALFAGNVNPAPSWDASNFTAQSTEYQDYTEGTRQEYVETAPSGGSMNNLSNKAAFTIGVGGATIYGAALLSSSVKGGTTGKLYAATRFTNPRVLVENDILNVGYTLAIANAP